MLIVAASIAAYFALEGDLFEGVLHLRAWSSWALRQFGVLASLSLLYVEESGLPLPVRGDVYVAYIGRAATWSVPSLIAGISLFDPSRLVTDAGQVIDAH
jgi:hypothetical protein